MQHIKVLIKNQPENQPETTMLIKVVPEYDQKLMIMFANWDSIN